MIILYILDTNTSKLRCKHRKKGVYNERWFQEQLFDLLTGVTSFYENSVQILN